MTRGKTDVAKVRMAEVSNGNDYGRELLRQHYLTSPHHR